jgi:hypothetical protein
MSGIGFQNRVALNLLFDLLLSEICGVKVKNIKLNTKNAFFIEIQSPAGFDARLLFEVCYLKNFTND